MQAAGRVTESAMPKKKVLLIESDAAFAREMTDALEQKGFEARASGDGAEGLALAREMAPAAIVLCVELPRLSGYSICNKLKRDDVLKRIPLLIISAEATPETFEQHKKLKTRAEDYLVKPFPVAQLVERIGALLGDAGGEEEVVTLAEAEVAGAGDVEGGVEIRADGPPARPEPSSRAPGPDAEDEDLKLLDDAFDSISAESGGSPEIRPAEKRVEEDELLAAAESLPGLEDEASPSEIGDLASGADAALDSLSPGNDEPPPPPPAARADVLRAAGIPLLDTEPPRRATPPPPPRPPPAARAEASARQSAEAKHEIESLRRELEGARAATARAEREARDRAGDLKLQKTKLDSMSATVKRLETDLKNAREETRRATEKAAAAESTGEELRGRVEKAARAAVEKGAAADDAARRLAAVEQELEELKTELLAARGEAAGGGGSGDADVAALRRRVQELESATAKHEERVVKAYRKIKSDERVRERTRKALTIALQLLDERTPAQPGKKGSRSAARE